MKISSLSKVLLITVCLACPGIAVAQKATADLYDFGKIGLHAAMEHTFEFQNNSAEILEVENVQLVPPLTVARMSSRIAPGALGTVTIRMEQPRQKGDFRSFVSIKFKNQAAPPVVFWVTGKLADSIDFDPFPAFFVTAQRGEVKTESLEISSQEADPLEVMNVLHDSSRYQTKLDTLESGHRYRLSITLNADAPAGRETDYITLVTSSPDHPFLKVQANTNIRERVYAFPEEVDLETLNASELSKPGQAGSLSQSLVVYQTGGKDFQISAQTDVPFLRLTTRQAQLKDRFGIQVDVIPDKLKPGAVDGSILISTNDPEFPQLRVPVKATVEESR